MRCETEISTPADLTEPAPRPRGRNIAREKNTDTEMDGFLFLVKRWNQLNNDPVESVNLSGC